MNRGIETTAIGMLASQRAMDLIANNLANASTRGYKRDGLAFGETLSRQIGVPNGNDPIDKPLPGVGVAASFTVFEQGALETTGRPFDVALASNRGMFAIQTEAGVRYTRDGAFTLNSDGVLSTVRGEPVLDDGGLPIQIPQGEIATSEDGSISADGVVVARLGVFDGTFAKDGAGRFQSQDAEPDPELRVQWRALESSNVNHIQSMIQLIEVGRAFELAQRSIQQQDELTQKLIQSLHNS